MMRCAARFSILIAALSGFGCQPAGPARYPLSGMVTFDGEPIPRGMIFLEPDAAEGNQGPSATAEIIAGKFSLPTDRGTVGGIYKVRITGFDGVPVTLGKMEMPEGTALFPDYVTTTELSAGASTVDFEVPVPEE